MKTFINSSLAVIALFVFYSCTQENDLLENDMSKQGINSFYASEAASNVAELILDDEICGTVIEKELISKGEFTGGKLYLANDSENLILIFQAAEGWLIAETHLYFGNLDDMTSPGKGKATVAVGQFPYKAHYDPPLLEAPPIYLPLDNLPFDGEDELIIVAHATVVSSEDVELPSRSVYAEWDEWLWFSGPQWGGGFVYQKELCDETSANTAAIVNEDESLVEPLVSSLACFSPESLNLTFDNEDVVGTVSFSMDEFMENMLVTYTLPAESEWDLSVIHINIGPLEFNQVSKGKKANPVVGQFDYVYHLDELDDPKNYPYPIPVDGLDPEFLSGECETFIVQVTLSQEVVVDDEVEVLTKSAFAEWEVSFNAPKKGGYFTLCMVDCPLE